METLSSATDRKPPPTAACTQPCALEAPTGRIRTKLPGARMPRTGVCPVSKPMSPSSVLATTRSASPAQTSPSGTTSFTCRVTVSPRATPSRPLQLLRLALHVLDPAGHVKGLLGQVVVLAFGDCLERGDGLLERDEHAGLTGELLGHVHRVREEPLDPPSPLDSDLVLFRELVDAQDGDDVLQLLVPLQNPLHLARDLVVLPADVLGVQDPRGGVQGVHGRVDALLRDRAREHPRRVQAGECGVG